MKYFAKVYVISKSSAKNVKEADYLEKLKITTALSFRGDDIDLYHPKMSDNFADIFWTNAALVKYLKEKWLSGNKLQLFFKYIAKLYVISKLSSKISKKQTTFFQLFSCYKFCLCEKNVSL